MNKEDNRGRPRDTVYEGVMNDVLAHIKKYPAKKDREWLYDISPACGGTQSDAAKRARFLGFRQSTVFKEAKEALKAKGYKLKLTFSNSGENTAIIRVRKLVK